MAGSRRDETPLIIYAMFLVAVVLIPLSMKRCSVVRSEEARKQLEFVEDDLRAIYDRNYPDIMTQINLYKNAENETIKMSVKEFLQIQDEVQWAKEQLEEELRDRVGDSD